jgi:putative pyruvate formate lyase activating enzyme
MSQYTPVQELIETKLKFEKQLQRRLTTYEYNKVIEHALERGFSHILGQERSSATASYTPDFSNFNQN